MHMTIRCQQENVTL